MNSTSRTFRTVIIILFFGFIFVFFSHPFEGNGDFYHHLNSGKYIVENRQLPNLDTYSHTAYNHPWVAYSWGSGTIYYLIFSLLGESGISIYSSLIAVLTFGLLFLLLKSYKVPLKERLVSLMLVAGPISTRWPERPETIIYPLTAGLLLIDKLRQLKAKWALLLPIIILIWANFYGSSTILGLGLIGFFIVKQFVKDKFKIIKDQRIFYLFALISFPISLINGYGFRTIFYLMLYIPKVAAYEGEWASVWNLLFKVPPGYLVTFQYYLIIYFLFLLIFILLLGLSFKIWRKILPSLLLSLSIFAPFIVFRYLPLGALLAVPFLGLALSFQNKKRGGLFLVLVFLIGLIMIGVSFWVRPASLHFGEYKVNPLIEFIQKNQLSGKAFNTGHWGAFLTYYLYPKVLVYFDTRDELYLDSIPVRELYTYFLENKPISPLLKKYQIDLVIADKAEDRLNYRDLFYSRDWTIVYMSGQYFVAVPTYKAQEKGLKAIDFVDPFSLSGAKAGFESQATEYYQNQLRLNPDSNDSKSALATILLSQKRYLEAINTLQTVKINISTPFGPALEQNKNLNLAEGYIGLKNCSITKEYLDRGEKLSRPLLLLPSQAKLPTKINKLYAFYYLVCQKDVNKASIYLNKFTNEDDATPLEKLRVSKEFDELKINIIK